MRVVGWFRLCEVFANNTERNTIRIRWRENEKVSRQQIALIILSLSCLVLAIAIATWSI